MDRPYGELALQDWMTFFDQIANSPPEKIVITGGEPIMYPGFFDITEYCKLKMSDCSLQLMTNGTFVTSENAHRFTMFDEVRISIDGNEENTDLLRGKGCAKKAIEALKALRRENVNVTASVTVMPDSGFTMTEIAKQVRMMGFNHVCLHPVKKVGKAKELLAGQKENCMLEDNCGVGQYLNLMPDGSAFPCHVLCTPDYYLGNVITDGYREVCNNLAEISRASVTG
jgi:MoaA/NifB/PqqE/SkfB family radical SAM enzyme